MDDDAYMDLWEETEHEKKQQQELSAAAVSQSINEQEADELGKVIMDLESSGEQH